MIGYLDKGIRPLVLIKTFKVEDKINELMSFHIYGLIWTIWTEIKELKSITLNALPPYDDRYIKTKIRTYGDRVCTKVFTSLA